MGEHVVELKNITKRFAKVLANDDVSMQIDKGEVVALLGENGAGKSTVMKILYGLYHATSGQILIDGRERQIETPKDAMNLGIAMIQQHFTLVGAHTVTENIILGNCRGKINYAEEEKRIQALSDDYHFGIPVKKYIQDLPVGVQQKVEILKALHLNARILIMDEPTAVLMPQESETLMQFIKQYVAKGNSVIFITHKMKEVMEVADRIIVMRAGKICGTVNRPETTEAELARMMIGHDLEIIRRSGEMDYTDGSRRLTVSGISIEPKNEVPVLSDISFDIYKGEVFGVAGVSGNGQEALCEAICDAVPLTGGSISLDGEDITKLSVEERIARGIGYVASDRYRYGMVAPMSLSENMLLKSSYADRWQKHGIINWNGLNSYTEERIRTFDIKAPDHTISAGSLSGGNQQKMVVAREVDIGSNLIIFDQPTRGLDIGAINYVHKTILSEKAQGKSVLLISTELSEIFALADRIAVIYRGRFMGIYKPEELNTEKIGLLMAGMPDGKGAAANA